MSPDLLLVLALAAPLVVLAIAGRRHRARRSAAAETVDLVVDDRGVRRRLADGRQEEVSWDELLEVGILSAPAGRSDRRRFVLAGPGPRGCLVPVELAGEQRLLERLAALPGFDHAALPAALEARGHTRHTLWRRPPD